MLKQTLNKVEFSKQSNWSIPVQSRILQRKCACGGANQAGGCEDCEKENLQRKTAGKPQERFSVPPIVAEVLSGVGEPLEFQTRAQMESRIGHDFSKIRIHTDTRAAESARAVNALAYTVGKDVVFAAGHYQPQTRAGRQLIAHELAHTIQQEGESADESFYAQSNHRAHVAISTDHAAETEADQIAEAVATGAPLVLTPKRALTLARQEREVPGPSTTTEEEKPKEDFSKVGRSKEWGREKTLWGWGSPETNNIYQECQVEPMKRARFLAFARTVNLPPDEKGCKPLDAEDVLGLTRFDAKNAVPPKIAAVPFQDQNKTVYKLKPTHAEMPPLQAAYTQAGDYVEGTRKYVEQECAGERIRRKSGDFPVHWTITEAGANLIKAAEEEHCKDVEVAFNLTLGIFASAINNVAAAERTYSTEKDAIKDGTNAITSIGVKPSEMILEFYKMAIKTRLRDSSDWHTANASLGAARRYRKQPTQENGCRHTETIDAGSFENVGKPGSYDLMEMEVKPAAAKKKSGRCR